MMLQVIAYTVAVAAVLSAVGLCAERFARLHRLPRRAVWAVAMLLSVLLPAAMILLARPAEVRNVPLSAAQKDVPYISTEPADFAEAPAAQSGAQSLPSVASVPVAQSTIVSSRSAGTLPRPSDRLLLTAWMVASSGLALYLLGANLLLRRRMQGWHSATVHDHQVLISEVTGPALLGAFSPRIVLPRWLLLQPQGTQALILAHEQQHVLARDALLILAGLLAIVAVPWNLPLWWQWRRMRQAIEMDCDARVLGAGVEANTYAQVLLAVTRRSGTTPAGALAMSEPVHALEQRIANLLPDAIRYARLQSIAVLLLAAAGAGAALALEAPALPGRTAAAPREAPRVIEPSPAVQAQKPARPATTPPSFKEGEYLMAVVTRGDIENLVTSTGTLMPRDYVDVGAQVSGLIEKIYVEVGDVVKKGDALAKLNAEESRAHLESAEAQLAIFKLSLETDKENLTKSERDYQRQKALFEQDPTAKESLLDTEAAYENAKRQVRAGELKVLQQEASMRIDRKNLASTTILAPLDGTVMNVNVKEGQRINASQQVPNVMQIANLSTMTVQSGVSEVDVPKLHKGNAAYFTTLGSNGRRWYGELKRIEPTPKVKNGVVTYNALFDVQNEGHSLKPQMTAQVYFVLSEARNVLLVPLAALQQGQQIATPAGTQRRTGTVMVKKADGTLEARQVVVGVTDRVQVEVVEGLKEGEKVVVGKR